MPTATKPSHPLSTTALLLCCSLLAACEVQSRVQGRYIEAQENCRSEAEDAVAQQPNAAAMTPDQHSAEVVNQFSICMNKAGWHVANPMKLKSDNAAAAVPARPAAAPPPAPATPATAAPPQGSAAAQPDAVAPAAHYERNGDAPAAATGDDSNGRQF